MKLQVLRKPGPIITRGITKVQEEVVDRIDVFLDLLAWDDGSDHKQSLGLRALGFLGGRKEFRVEGFRVFRV